MAAVTSCENMLYDQEFGQWPVASDLKIGLYLDSY